jgi:ubiquinone/menaquinone biosynthesis C-methylase UbiE
MDNPQNIIQQQFGAHADQYATSAVHAQGESLARLVELTKPQGDWTVLDVSTGAGHTALAFAPRVAQVIAVDLTPRMLDTARKLANERGMLNIEFKPVDAHELPFDDRTFDLVTNRIALHHYTNARQAIAEMSRVCKHGGIVALTDNIVPPDKQTAGYINHLEQLRDPSHNWAYPLPRLEAMFADAGLQVEHSEHFSKELELEPWADRMGASLEIKAKLRALLNDAPPAVRDWLMPHADGEKLFFTLHEAIIIGRES